jgi:hypothetical protein
VRDAGNAGPKQRWMLVDGIELSFAFCFAISVHVVEIDGQWSWPTNQDFIRSFAPAAGNRRVLGMFFVMPIPKYYKKFRGVCSVVP